MTKTEIIFDVGCLAAAGLAFVMPNQSQAFMGAALGSFLASVAVPGISRKSGGSLKQRLSLHGALGMIFGPFFAYQLADIWPSYPIASLAMASSGAVGLAGVSGIPPMIRFLLRLPPNDPTNDRHGKPTDKSGEDR